MFTSSDARAIALDNLFIKFQKNKELEDFRKLVEAKIQEAAVQGYFSTKVDDIPNKLFDDLHDLLTASGYNVETFDVEYIKPTCTFYIGWIK